MKTQVIDSEIVRISGTNSMPENNQIGFIGPTPGGAKIRNAYARLASDDLTPYLADLGNLSIKRGPQIQDILLEMSQDGHRILYCNGSQAHPMLNDDFWQFYIHPVIISNQPYEGCYDFAHIGLQKHLCPDNFTIKPHRHLRLGELRSNVEKSEVLLRHADCIVIDLNVLRFGDNLGCTACLPAGLMIEELCQIVKYAGASSHLKTIIINGFDQNQDDFGMMTQNIALLMYYILDGLAIGLRERQQHEQLQRYTVLPDHSARELVFIEDQRSGRWWVELYSDGAEEEVKMACTREDYEDACNNLISERITNLLTLA